jgi:DNA invertase Pin-like site-specific DNA recombinase
MLLRMRDLGPVLRDPGDPMLTAIRRVMGAFAELGRTRMIKRLRDGRAAEARAGGKPSGGYPYRH